MRNPIRLAKTGFQQLLESHPALRRPVHAGVTAVRRGRYALRKAAAPLSEHSILFCAYQGRSYSCSPKAIYEYLLTDPKFRDYTFTWVLKDPARYPFLLENRNTFLVRPGTRDYERALARAKYWVFNFRTADHLSPRRGQVYLQCWHGTPLKRLGCDIEFSGASFHTLPEIRRRYHRDARQFHYLLSPSPAATKTFISAWDLDRLLPPLSILEIGYPRDDILIQNPPQAQAFRRALGSPPDKTVVLYAPTWRDDQHRAGVGYTYAPALDFARLQSLLGDRFVILFRAHYLIASQFDFSQYAGFLYDVSAVDDINTLYLISDLLVTDYSSVFFDYACLCRPILFYMYDLEHYESQMRGFYLKKEALPGPILQTEEALADAIVQYSAHFSCDERYQAFNRVYNALNDGRAAQRFVEFCFRETPADAQDR